LAPPFLNVHEITLQCVDVAQAEPGMPGSVELPPHSPPQQREERVMCRATPIHQEAWKSRLQVSLGRVGTLVNPPFRASTRHVTISYIITHLVVNLTFPKPHLVQ
jgi:hypothetical protein